MFAAGVGAQIYSQVTSVAKDMHLRLGASASQVGINGDTTKLLGIINQLQQKLQETHVDAASPPPKSVDVNSASPAKGMLAIEAPPRSVEAPAATKEARDAIGETTADASAAAGKTKLKADESPRPIATPARSHAEVLDKIRALNEQSKEARKPKPLKMGGGSVSGGPSVCDSESLPGSTESGASPPVAAAATGEAGDDVPEVGAAVMINSTTHKKEYMRLESSRHYGLSCLWGNLLHGSARELSILMIFIQLRNASLMVASWLRPILGCTPWPMAP